VGLPRPRARLGVARARRSTGAGDHHINADEPSVLDYNTNFKSPGQVASLYAPDQFRTSDHDPILTGIAPVVDRATTTTVTSSLKPVPDRPAGAVHRQP
jgi:hypothetical protein